MRRHQFKFRINFNLALRFEGFESGGLYIESISQIDRGGDVTPKVCAELKNLPSTTRSLLQHTLQQKQCDTKLELT